MIQEGRGAGHLQSPLEEFARVVAWGLEISVKTGLTCFDTLARRCWRVSEKRLKGRRRRRRLRCGSSRLWWRGSGGGAVAQERDPPAAKMAALHTGGDGTPPLPAARRGRLAPPCGRDGARPSRRLAEDGSPHPAAATERGPPSALPGWWLSMRHARGAGFMSQISGLPRRIPPPSRRRRGGSHRRKSFKFLRKVPYQK